MNTMSTNRKLEPVLKAAAAFFVVVGVGLAVYPDVLFDALKAPLPDPLMLARWLGVVLAAFGMSTVFAAVNPRRHWPILLSGVLGMLCSVLMALSAVRSGSVEPGLGWFVVVAGLLWGVPFACALWWVAAAPADRLAVPALPENIDFDSYRTQDGRSLASLSNESPVLLVLLRHLGCPFCRETLADLAAQRQAIEAAGAKIVFAHMGDEESRKYLFERYRLDDLPRISDPDARLYRALGLQRASLLQVYGPAMWRYAIQAILLDGHGMGQIVGDRFQMPGAFLIHNGAVLGGFRHQRISDHPDYLSIVRCLSAAEEADY